VQTQEASEHCGMFHQRMCHTVRRFLLPGLHACAVLIFSLNDALVVNGQHWMQQHKFRRADPCDPVLNATFGYEVAVDGDHAVVGDHNDPFDVNGANELLGAGSAYVYQRVGNGWALQQKIVADDRTVDAGFGDDLVIQNGRILVGASKALSGGTSSGAAYLFEG
jgi:hypothetical protein